VIATDTAGSGSRCKITYAGWGKGGKPFYDYIGKPAFFGARPKIAIKSGRQRIRPEEPLFNEFNRAVEKRGGVTGGGGETWAISQRECLQKKLWQSKDSAASIRDRHLF